MLNSESKFVVTTTAMLEKVKEATAGLEVKIIVIGDEVEGSCFDYKKLINNNGELIDGYFSLKTQFLSSLFVGLKPQTSTQCMCSPTAAEQQVCQKV